jgi:hypothetical protein
MGNVYRDKGGIMRGGPTFRKRAEKAILVKEPAANANDKSRPVYA